MVILSGQDSHWSDERNRLLAVALTLLETETCNSCGTPAWHGQSTDNTIAFSVHTSVCYGCAELAKDQEARKNSRGTKGEVRYVKAQNVWGEEHELPTRHDSYLTINKEG
jgi:hypothetical protein